MEETLMTLSRSNRKRGWRPDFLLTDVIMANAEANTKIELSECDLENESGAVRRPMNAFLIFCKRHRSLVREKYPHMENRSITKILGEWWANLEANEKVTYTDLAKQYKEAFMKANPDFRWYKLPTPSSRTLVTRPSNQRSSKMEPNPNSCVAMISKCGISPGKLADETQLGGLNSLISTQPTAASLLSKPPKKRYLHNGAFLNSESTTVSDPQTTSACSALLELASLCTAKDKIKLCSSESSTNSSNKEDKLGSTSDSTATTVSQQQLINCIIESTIGSNTDEGTRFNGNTSSHLFSNKREYEFNDNEDEVEMEENEGETTELDALAEKLHQHLRSKTAGACRKSERKGKGSRYQAMISEGILQPPKDRRNAAPAAVKRSYEGMEAKPKICSTSFKKSTFFHQRNSKKLNLDEQIAALPRCNFEALVERKKKIEGSEFCETNEQDEPEFKNDDENTFSEAQNTSEQKLSEEMDDDCKTRFQSGEFDLEKQIAALPSLNIDVLNQRKKQQRYKNQTQSKNTPRNKCKADTNFTATGMSEEKSTSSLNNHLVGSQKRKARKRSITHLDPTAQNKPYTSVVESTLIESMSWKSK